MLSIQMSGSFFTIFPDIENDFSFFSGDLFLFWAISDNYTSRAAMYREYSLS